MQDHGEEPMNRRAASGASAIASRLLSAFLLLPCAGMAQVAVRANAISVLYADQNSSTQGSIAIQNQGATWSGTGSMRWTLNVTAAGNYKFKILNAVSGNANGIAMRISSQSGSTLDFTLKQTPGIMLQGYARDTLAGTLALPQGSQWIELGSVNVPAGRNVMGFRGLELYPAAAEAAITAGYARAKAARASTDWMLQAKYGTMHHWTTNSINQQGNKVPFQQMVAGFDVSKFANQEAEMGVGYVLFTVAHVSPTFPAPLASWAKYHPGLTTQRDLVMEMADSLNARGIKLMLYFPPQYAWAATTAGFMTASREMLTEIGLRYGKKVAGYWFDGFYQNAEKYPDADFDSLDQFCKAGNPDRVVALNSWIYPVVSPWQDYWAAEAAGLVTPPPNRYLPEVSAFGLQSHLLSILEPNWWMDQPGRTPSYSAQTMVNYVLACMKNGVVPTINTMVYADGTLLPSSLEIFRRIKLAVANVKPVVGIAPQITLDKNPVPRPGFRELVIDGADNSGEAVIYSMAGNKVDAFPLSPGKHVLAYRDLHVPPGLYLIRVKQTARKFLITP